METFFADYLSRLERLHENCSQSIEDLSVEALDWQPGPGMNSIAVLITHLAGAERYWIGDIVGRDSSGRVRAEEFQTQGLDAATLLERLSGTLAHSRGVLEQLEMSDLSSLRTSPMHEGDFTVGWALAHALEHSALHTGHIEITRQLWDQQA
jgi:uncharacterized damage-inducible protein DinB